jgi:hypothetical protein
VRDKGVYILEMIFKFDRSVSLKGRIFLFPPKSKIFLLGFVVTVQFWGIRLESNSWVLNSLTLRYFKSISNDTKLLL